MSFGSSGINFLDLIQHPGSYSNSQNPAALHYGHYVTQNSGGDNGQDYQQFYSDDPRIGGGGEILINGKAYYQITNPGNVKDPTLNISDPEFGDLSPVDNFKNTDSWLDRNMLGIVGGALTAGVLSHAGAFGGAAGGEGGGELMGPPDPTPGGESVFGPPNPPPSGGEVVGPPAPPPSGGGGGADIFGPPPEEVGPPMGPPAPEGPPEFVGPPEPETPGGQFGPPDPNAIEGPPEQSFLDRLLNGLHNLPPVPSSLLNQLTGPPGGGGGGGGGAGHGVGAGLGVGGVKGARPEMVQNPYAKPKPPDILSLFEYMKGAK